MAHLTNINFFFAFQKQKLVAHHILHQNISDGSFSPISRLVIRVMKRLPYICTLVVRGVLRGRGVWPLHSSQFSFYLKYIFKFFVKLLKSNPCKLCQIRNITYATAGGCGVKMARGYDVTLIDLGGKPLDSVSWKERFLRERERERTHSHGVQIPRKLLSLCCQS